MSKPGRNDPCPCGSGKKYKKCCLPRDEEARRREEAARPKAATTDGEKPFIAEMRPDLDDEVDHLLEKLELGAGRAVEADIQALLEKHPLYHMTHYAMGVYLATVEEDPVRALPFFEQAVQIFPPFAAAHYNLGGAAMKAGDAAKAVTAYRAAVRYSHEGDGIAKLARPQLDFLEKILLKDSSFSTLDAYLANAKMFDDAFVCLTRQEFEKAVELFNRVLSENPKHVQSFGNLALAYAGLGKRAAAMECFDRALALDPGYEPAIINRRITERMREGEPHIPDGIQEVHYYADRFKEEMGQR